MSVFWRHAVLLVLSLGAVLGARAASAGWVETLVQSDLITVEASRDGTALVRHELVVRVKGGPLQSLTLDGVDGDALVTGDATVVRTEGGEAPRAVLVERGDDQTLRLEIDGKGIPRGTWLFRFAYRTDLNQGERLRLRGDRLELGWVGPRHADGLDLAKVVFRLPRGAQAPELWPDEAVQGDRDMGVFQSALRRGAEHDELELARPHVAKSEPVLWRVRVAPDAFDGFTTANPALAAAVAPPPPARHDHWYGIAALVGLAYGALVLQKGRLAARAAELRQATAPGLLPLPLPLRALLAAAGVGGAVLAAALGAELVGAGGLLSAATLLGVQRTPVPSAVLRRPGRWLALRDEEAFAAPAPAVPGAWLDAGRLAGFLVFVGLLGALAATAWLVFLRSPHHGVLVALGSVALVPVFFTGRAAELPADPARTPAGMLGWIAAGISATGSARVTPWARVPEGSATPDELRLLVSPLHPRKGLLAVELAVEFDHYPGGSVAQPCVLVRALEGSDAQAALPRGVSWTRGRRAEERVAVVRCALPSRASARDLALRVIALCSRPTPPDAGSRQPSSSARRSAGKGAFTVKSIPVAAAVPASRLACSA